MFLLVATIDVAYAAVHNSGHRALNIPMGKGDEVSTSQKMENLRTSARLGEELVNKVVRFESDNFRRNFITTREDRSVWIQKSGGVTQSFLVIPGLAGVGVSFVEDFIGGRILRHREDLVYVDGNDRSQQFKEDATWFPIPGFDGKGMSFRSLNNLDKYLRHENSRIKISEFSPGVFAKDATWFILS